MVEEVKFEYSPLGKIFNRGLEEKDKNEELLKKLKYIVGKNEEHLEAIKNQGKNQLKRIENNE